MFVVIIIQSCPHFWLITRFVTGVKCQVSQVDQKLLLFRSTWVHPRFFSGVSVARSLVFCAMFWISLFVLLGGHCIVYPSSYGLWLHLWYLQTFLIHSCTAWIKSSLFFIRKKNWRLIWRCIAHLIIHMQVRVQSDLAQKYFIYFHIIGPVFKYILLLWPFWICDRYKKHICP